jgi:plastocyanin
MRFAVFAILFGMTAATAFAGSVTGTIKFEGTPPTMKAKDAELKADPVCAAHKRDKPLTEEFLVLGEGQTMANVLVEVISGLPAKEYPVPKEPVIVTQEGCQYKPHVFAVMAGQPVKFLNPDGTMHNVNGTPKVNTPFNFGMPRDLKEKEVIFDKPEPMFPLNCSVHPWMRAYCAVVTNPYFAVTGLDGKFTIEGLEPGEYEIRATHESRLGSKTAKVTVTADGAAVADFTYALPAKK